MDIINEILEMIEANKAAMKNKAGWVVVLGAYNPENWTPVFINEAGNEEHGFYDAAIFDTVEEAVDFWAYVSKDNEIKNYGVCRCSEI